MSSFLDRIVYKLPGGRWANRRLDSELPSSMHPTQAEAAAAAERDLKREGGEHVVVSNRLGDFREEPMRPSRDPAPSKGGADGYSAPA